MNSASSVQEQTFSTLREQIITMQLLPGTAMSVYEISGKLNVSRTPVREAFIRLAAESLVQVLPQRGTLVSRIDFARVKQERFLREALELAAIPQFLARCTEEHIAEMSAICLRHAAAVEQGDAVGALALDDEFHRSIFWGAGQMLSWRAIEERNGHYRRVRLLMVQEHGEARGVIEEHLRMTEAFQARDVRRAVACTEDHLRQIIYREDALRREFPDYFDAPEETSAPSPAPAAPT